MKQQDIMKHMKKSIANIFNESPIMLIAGARYEFLHAYKGAYHSLTSSWTVDQFIEVHSGKRYKTPLVLDIAFSSAQAENGLLKFIEESKTPIICMAEFDKCSPILMSRFKAVYKFPQYKVSNQFLSIKQATEEMNKPNPILDNDTRISQLSPQYYKLINTTPIKRIQELLGDYYDRFNR